MQQILFSEVISIILFELVFLEFSFFISKAFLIINEEGKNFNIDKIIDQNKAAFKLLKEFELHEKFKKNIDLTIAKRIIKLSADSSFSVNDSLSSKQE